MIFFKLPHSMRYFFESRAHGILNQLHPTLHSTLHSTPHPFRPSTPTKDCKAPATTAKVAGVPKTNSEKFTYNVKSVSSSEE